MTTPHLLFITARVDLANDVGLEASKVYSFASGRRLLFHQGPVLLEELRVRRQGSGLQRDLSLVQVVQEVLVF